VRWSSLANGSAARGLVLLLAFTLSCVPLCSPRMCAHNCCASHSGSCGSGIDQSPTPGCTRSTALLFNCLPPGREGRVHPGFGPCRRLRRLPSLPLLDFHCIAIRHPHHRYTCASIAHLIPDLPRSCVGHDPACFSHHRRGSSMLRFFERRSPCFSPRKSPPRTLRSPKCR